MLADEHVWSKHATSPAAGSQQPEQLFRLIPSKAEEGLSKGAWLEPAQGLGDPWAGAAPLCSQAGAVTRVMALGISKHCILSQESGIWWEIGSFGFSHLACVGVWIRAVDGVCCVRAPAPPKGDLGGTH